MVADPSSMIELRYESFRLEDEDVPETPLHDAIIELLMLILKPAFEGRSALICSNLACRWDPSDARVGMDPDVVLIEPAPPEGETLSALRVWEPEHVAPRVAVEVVSRSHPDKDYLDAPLRAARLGVRELWVFDPLLVGPDRTGGPYRLQVWGFDPSAPGRSMRRRYAGAGPGYSEELGAWLVPTDEGTRLRLAEDPAGQRLWPTAAEAARAEAALERSEKAVERAEKEFERAERLRLAEKLRALGVDPDAD